MLDEPKLEYDENASWTPSAHAIAFESFEPAARNARSSRIVKHGTWPFEQEIDVATDETRGLYLLGYRYLERLNAVLEEIGHDDGIGLPTGWIDALDPDEQTKPGTRLRWRPIWPAFGAGSSEVPAAPQSWRLLRASGDAQADPWAGTVILSAMETTAPNDHDPVIVNKDLGLRVVVSLSVQDQRLVGRIRSMTAELPFPPFISWTEFVLRPGTAADKDIPQQFGDFVQGEGFVPALAQLEEDLQLTTSALMLSDFRVFLDTEEKAVFLELRGLARGALSSDKNPVAYRFGGDFRSTSDGGEFEYVRGRKHPVTANADAGETKVFRQDPASWREARSGVAPPLDYDYMGRLPPRPDEALDAFREDVRIGPNANTPLETDWFVVRNCPDFVPGDPPNGTKSVDLPADAPALPIRSNDFTAVMAFYTAREFFRIVEGVDIDLNNLVVAAQQQIQIFYRSGITPGPGKNGKTINARVSITPEEGEVLPAIEVHYALANLSRMRRDLSLPRDKRWAQPLGIADAERWVWHEFGHVMIAARLGQLEFDFVHSIGDGISAVRADPFYRTADMRGEAVGLSGTIDPNFLPLPLSDRFRGMTFPWVFIPRRHDRNVTLGWAWGGSLNRSLLNAPEEDRKDQKGYITEQILSSTLFRLYLILGGDTLGAEGQPDFVARERASAITLFLVLEGTRTLSQPPSRVEAFEEAMEAADVTRQFPLPLPRSLPDIGDTSTLPVPWSGGAARKVVRWAFEAQGMYPPFPDENHNAPGNPPAVDIYIPDMRPLEEPTENGRVTHGPGGYVPVSLDWQGERLWQSDPDALKISLDVISFQIDVTIENRGTHDATGIELRWWIGLYFGDAASDGWATTDSIIWLAKGTETPIGTVPAGGTGTHAFSGQFDEEPDVEFGFVLVVETSCPGDRANSDYKSALACRIPNGANPPKVPMALCDLVANDNNLGIRMISV